ALGLKQAMGSFCKGLFLVLTSGVTLVFLLWPESLQLVGLDKYLPPSETPPPLEPEAKPTVTFLRLDEQAAEVFESWPLGPMDYAVLLNSIRTFQPAVIAIEPVLNWAETFPAAERVLKNEMLRSRTVIGSVFDADALRPITPETLTAPLPLTNVTGDMQKIPTFNGLAAFPNFEILTVSKTGFTGIEFGEDAGVTPGGNLQLALVGRLEQTLYPSFVLRVLMAQHQAKPDEVEIHPGQYVKVGDLEIPIDEAGRVLFNLRSWDQVISHPVETALPLEPPGEAPDQIPVDPANLTIEVVLIGQDDPVARGFRLPDGTGISRAELLSIALGAIHAGEFAIESPLPGPVEVFLTRFEKEIKLGAGALLVSLLGSLILCLRYPAATSGAMIFQAIVLLGMLALAWFRWPLELPLIPASGILVALLLGLFGPGSGKK
ncbi:MAG: CHASE2 domain-containing protein, partial [Verrucomicrobiota bacterium]